MQMSDMLKRIGTAAMVSLTVLAGCSSSSPKARKGASSMSKQDAEVEYLAFRASHKGVKIQPNQLKSSEPQATVAMDEPAPTPPPKPQPVVTKPTPKPAPVPAPSPKPVVKPQPQPKPTTVVPAPKPQPKPVVSKPVAKPKPAPQPKPVSTPVPQQPEVVSPVKPVEVTMAHPKPKPITNPDRLVSNTSLSASDGFLSRRHQATSSEVNYKPIHREAPKPREATLPLPTMEQLVRDGKVYDARIVLKQVNDASLVQIAQAIRIIIKNKPRRGPMELYDVVREAKAAAPRAMAIDALLQAYPQNATYSAQKLLHQTRYNRIDRLVVGNRIMQYRINRTYPAAITNLGYDGSGKALFDARRGILAADKAVTHDLKNYAALHSTKHSSFIARRLYHWIRNDDTIEQAYEDTFVKHPSELGVIMFRERFGEEALDLLKQAQGKVDHKLEPIVAHEIARMTDKNTSPTLMFGYQKLYLISYQTAGGHYTLLTDQTIWPDQAKDETYQQSDATSTFTQKVINVKTDQLTQIKKLPHEWKAGVKIQGIAVDKVDLK